MFQIVSCIQDQHVLTYVVTAVVVLTIGCASSMIVFHRGMAATAILTKRIWAALSGIVIAIGIWATHFVAMLGYRPGFTFSFDGATTLSSILIAVVGFAATSQILIGAVTPVRRAVCAIIATLTVAGMHYYGIGALKAAALIEYDTAYVVASMAVAFVFFALTYFSLSAERPWRNLLALVGTLLAVAGLHFTGMAAVSMVPVNGLQKIGWAVNPATVGTWVVAVVALIILMAALGAGLDSVLSRLSFQSQRKMSRLANAASEAIVIMNATGVVIDANDAAEALFDETRDKLIGQDAASLVGLADHRLGMTVRTAQEHYITISGERVPVDLTIRDLDDESNGLVAISLYDLRERLRNEAHIRKLAYSDQLTRLPNRAAFQKALGELWETAMREDRNFSIFLVDLDQFKDINDLFGHEAGDYVLQAAAARLQECFGDNALVSRLGGDEFAVLMPSVMDAHDLLSLAENCVELLTKSSMYGAVTVQTGASVGIATTSLRQTLTDDPASLLKAADRALYAAKEAGRGTARMYDAHLHDRTEQRRLLEVDLVEAVQKGEFVLHYQAKVCTETRRTLGYEALIRWNRPNHGLVMPADFIEIAEQSLIIQDIGRWCIYEACRAASKWDKGMSVSVNLSARQFLDPNLHATVRDAIRKSGISPGQLELEITETALIQNTVVAARILDSLKKLGIQIALDDFGTGYSSMRFVQQLPFDRIKIDRSFVATMGTDKKAFAIIDAILRLGASLSIPVVAEGVETDEQALMLAKARCSELQGFLISRPAPMDEQLMPVNRGTALSA